MPSCNITCTASSYFTRSASAFIYRTRATRTDLFLKTYLPLTVSAGWWLGMLPAVRSAVDRPTSCNMAVWSNIALQINCWQRGRCELANEGLLHGNLTIALAVLAVKRGGNARCIYRCRKPRWRIPLVSLSSLSAKRGAKHSGAAGLGLTRVRVSVGGRRTTLLQGQLFTRRIVTRQTLVSEGSHIFILTNKHSLTCKTEGAMITVIPKTKAYLVTWSRTLSDVYRPCS